MPKTAQSDKLPQTPATAVKSHVPSRPISDSHKSDKDSNGVVLLIGAAGFVGSRLAKAICDLDIHVIGIDNQIHANQENIIDLEGNEYFELLESDILEGIPSSIIHKHITHIIYAADVVSHIGDEKRSLNRLLDNSVGLKNILEFANKLRATVIYTSSVDIYQGLASHEQLHNYYDGKDFGNYYAFLEGKRYGEALCREYVERFGVDIRIARFPEIYGPGMDLNSFTILGQSIRLALQGKDLILQEVGSREHQLLFIDDAVYGLIKLIFNEDERSQGGIFYFVNPERVSTLSIVYTLKEIIKKDLGVEFVPLPQKVGLPETQQIDISRSEKILNWSPHIDLTNGLERTLSWFIDKDKQPDEKDSVQPRPLPSVPINDQEKDSIHSGRHKIMPTLPLPKMPHIGLPLRTIPSATEKPEPSIKPQLPQPKPIEPKIEPPKKGNPPFALGQVAPVFPTKTAQIPAIPKKPFKIPTVPKISIKFPKITIPKLRFKINVRPTKRFFIFGGTIAALLGILLIPFITLLGTARIAIAQTQSLNYDSALTYYGYSQGLLTLYDKPAHWVGLGEQYSIAQSGLSAGVEATRLLRDVEGSMTPLAELGEQLMHSFGNKNVADEDELTVSSDEANKMVESAVAGLRDAQTNFGLLKKRVDGIHESSIPAMFRDEIQDIKSLLWLLEPTVNNSDRLIGALPELLGFKNQRRYVILLQNNNEIRPTGGFIGSYAAFNISKSQFNQFKVDDIYNPDGLLQPHTNPPEPESMKKYLDVDFLGSRDSGWWPDFPTSAEVFKTLYERATNERLDGVFAINLSLIRKVLEKTGSVYLDEYQEEVTAQNVFDRAQTHAEVGFKPGSTKKQDFLSALNSALLTKLAHLPSNQLKGLSEVIVRGLASRDIMIYSNESHIQELLKVSGLAGTLITNPGSDYLKVVDSNVGGNKSNYWVDRSTSYAVDVDRSGHLRGRLTIRWKHRGTSTTWPNGDYKDYLRVYVPLGAQQIKIEPAIPDQATYPSFERTVIEGLVEVPINTTQEVVISYTLPDSIGFSQGNTYNLVWENESGMSGESVDFTMNLPGFLTTTDSTSIQKQLTWPTNITISVSGTESIQKDPN
ncbi:DUF4012 domain-containing protein [candidate division WWE3 bacterium]|nr:DUF4012 domain-containing protein [candidate division WWE3 bacterium]